MPPLAFIQDVGVNAVSSVVAGLAAFVGTRLLSIGRHRRIWRLGAPQEVTICVARSGEGVQYNKPLTGIGQLRALALVAPSLERAYVRVSVAQKVLLATDGAGHRLEGDLITLGGGKSNTVTAAVLQELCQHYDLPATTTDVGIRWTGREPAEFVAAKRERDGMLHVVEDFGLVVHARNPFRPERRVIILAGASTFGTVAAARYLLQRGTRHRGEWLAVVRSPVSDGVALTPNVLRLGRRRKDGQWH